MNKLHAKMTPRVEAFVCVSAVCGVQVRPDKKVAVCVSSAFLGGYLLKVVLCVWRNGGRVFSSRRFWRFLSQAFF